MSYASVASHNAPPPSKQPKPDQNLFNTEPPADPIGVADDTAKVNIVGPKFREHPATSTSESNPLFGASDDERGAIDAKKDKAKKQARLSKDKARAALEEAEEDTIALWELAKEQLLRPGVAGGLLGVVNVGLLSWAGYSLYTRPHIRRDTQTLMIGTASAIGLLSAEGAYASYVAQTPEGRRDVDRAKREGSVVYRHLREALFRPGVPAALGTILGLVNLAVVGGTGWLAYCYWDVPRWDRRVVTATTVGLLTLWTGEGVLAEKYREKKDEYRRR